MTGGGQCSRPTIVKKVCPFILETRKIDFKDTYIYLSSDTESINF